MSTRIVHLLGDNAFREIVRGKEIILCPHAVDRLSFDQRKIFKESDLIRPISQESPALVGIQQNGRISTYFRRKDDYLKIILEATKKNVEVVTFMRTNTLPSIHHEKTP